MSTRLKFDDCIVISNDGASMELVFERPDSINVYRFLADVPRKGYGRALMNRLIRYAQKRKKRITLQVGRFKPWGMNNAQLATFYKSFGFVSLDEHDFFMEYVP